MLSSMDASKSCSVGALHGFVLQCHHSSTLAVLLCSSCVAPGRLCTALPAPGWICRAPFHPQAGPACCSQALAVASAHSLAAAAVLCYAVSLQAAANKLLLQQPASQVVPYWLFFVSFSWSGLVALLFTVYGLLLLGSAGAFLCPLSTSCSVSFRALVARTCCRKYALLGPCQVVMPY